MSNTTFTNFTTPAIDAGWLNDVNNLVYNLAGNGVSAPTNDSDVRTNIGLGTIATQNANNVVITGGSVSGITDLAIADGGTGASTAAAARTNLNVPQIGPTFSASLSANQAVASGSATVIIFDSEDFDTDSYYNNATGVFNPQVAGYYQVSFGALLDGNGNNFTSVVAILYKNGAIYFRGSQLNTTAAVTSFDSGGSLVVFMNGTTDTLDVRSFSTTSAGAPRVLGATGTRFTAHFIRP